MANKYYLGAACPVTDLKYFVFSGTWATPGETAFIEINGKRLTLTTTATMTLAQMTAAMAAMLTGDAAVNGEIRDCTGDLVGEFAILTVTSDATSFWVRLEGRADGRPIGTVTAGDTAASGTFASGGGTDRTGMGPHHWDNVDNWDSDTLPVVGDVITFDHRAAAGPRYNITIAYAPGAVYVTNGFSHDIGLPAINSDAANAPFDEPNAQYLSFTSCTDVRINASGARSSRLDFGSAASTIVVEGSGASDEVGVPAVLLKGNHASNVVTCIDGSVGYCIERMTTGNIGTLIVGGQGSPVFESGNSVTLGTVTVDSGTATLRSAITTLTQNGGEVFQEGAAIGCTTLNVLGGTCYPKTTGTYATVNHSAGSINTMKDVRGKTFTNYYMYGGSLIDPGGAITFTNGIRIYPKLNQVVLDLPPIKKYTLGVV